MAEEPPQMRPTTLTGGPFAHRDNGAGACSVCGWALTDVVGIGCPPVATYADDGERVTDARTFEQAARRVWRAR